MSYTNILKFVAVNIMADHYGRPEKFVALFIQSADSSSYTDDGKSSRSWSLRPIGQSWEVMADIVKMSSDCEGGCLRYKGNSKSKAETLIAACRNAIKYAQTVESLSSLNGQIFQSRIEMPVKEQEALIGSYKKELYKKLLADTTVAHKERFGNIVFEFTADFDGISKYLKFKDLAKGWIWGTTGVWDFDDKKFDSWALNQNESTSSLF